MHVFFLACDVDGFWIERKALEQSWADDEEEEDDDTKYLNLEGEDDGKIHVLSLCCAA